MSSWQSQNNSNIIWACHGTSKLLSPRVLVLEFPFGSEKSPRYHSLLDCAWLMVFRMIKRDGSMWDNLGAQESLLELDDNKAYGCLRKLKRTWDSYIVGWDWLDWELELGLDFYIKFFVKSVLLFICYMDLNQNSVESFLVVFQLLIFIKLNFGIKQHKTVFLCFNVKCSKLYKWP